MLLYRRSSALRRIASRQAFRRFPHGRPGLPAGLGDGGVPGSLEVHHVLERHGTSGFDLRGAELHDVALLRAAALFRRQRDGLSRNGRVRAALWGWQGHLRRGSRIAARCDVEEVAETIEAAACMPPLRWKVRQTNIDCWVESFMNADRERDTRKRPDLENDILRRSEARILAQNAPPASYL